MTVGASLSRAITRYLKKYCLSPVEPSLTVIVDVYVPGVLSLGTFPLKVASNVLDAVALLFALKAVFALVAVTPGGRLVI